MHWPSRPLSGKVCQDCIGGLHFLSLRFLASGPLWCQQYAHTKTVEICRNLIPAPPPPPKHTGIERHGKMRHPLMPDGDIYAYEVYLRTLGPIFITCRAIRIKS